MKRNLNLKNILVFVFALSFIAGLTVNADAQRKRTRTNRTTATAKTNNAVEIKNAAQDVGIQVKNVTKFVYVLGGIARGIEDIDKDIKAGKASREIADKNAQFKSDVIRSIRALRAGLVKLDTDFRAKPALRSYLIHIQNLNAQSARAEDLALAGRFNDAGKELLLVVEILTDTLVAMP